MLVNLLAMALFKRKGDVRKCVPFYVVGGILVVCGLPLMIAGIVGQFQGADLTGYAGGISILFGLGFILIWHMFTIENVEKNISAMEYDPNLRNIKDIVEKSRTLELSVVTGQTESIGFSNLAFVAEKSADSSFTTWRTSQETNGFPQENEIGDVDYNALQNDVQQALKVEISSSLMGSQLESKSSTTRSEYPDSAGHSSRNSIPLEIV